MSPYSRAQFSRVARTLSASIGKLPTRKWPLGPGGKVASEFIWVGMLGHPGSMWLFAKGQGRLSTHTWFPKVCSRGRLPHGRRAAVFRAWAKHDYLQGG